MMTNERYFLNVKSSAGGQAWLDALDNQASNNALAIAQKYGLSEQLARVLSARGIDEDLAVDYINPTLRSLMPDPLSFTDMEKAAKRIVDAIYKHENIAIFGDYDVDGACSSAILSRFLSEFGLSNRIYIPDRIVEGYGPNPVAMKMLVEDGATLIVTVDCGANSKDAIIAAKLAGADVVVLDHHQMGEIHDSADALVNPNRPDDLSGQGHLCAAGVVFMTIVRICRLLKEQNFTKNLPDILSYLDLVALATVCDVVPLVGVNRAFVVKGLQVARSFNNPGIAALAKVARIGEPLNNFHLGFLLGPRINAGGRIGDPALGAKLLTCNDIEQANAIADQLNLLNQERQEMESQQLAQAEANVDFLYQNGESPTVIVVSSDEWHPGIVGILAARLKEKFNCPAFAIAIKPDGSGAGSGRSIAGIDLGALVREAVDLGLLQKGGGHHMAAGLTINALKIEDFRLWAEQKISQNVDELRSKRSLEIDGAITATGATKELYNLIEQAGPFGSGNPTPIFVLPHHRLIDAREVGKGHLSISVANKEGKRLKAIAFRSVGTPLGDFLMSQIGENIHIAGNLTLNHWNGTVTPQLRIIDAAFVNQP